jgi:class 3 adenylate cyclase
LRSARRIGDVVEESDGDMMGEAVNIAARLDARRARPSAPCPWGG